MMVDPSSSVLARPPHSSEEQTILSPISDKSDESHSMEEYRQKKPKLVILKVISEKHQEYELENKTDTTSTLQNISE
mgnify:CR=1 FL=1